MSRRSSAEAAGATASLSATTVRADAWMEGLDDLLTRRPDLVGVCALADLALDSVRSAA
jgi:hypothetical protein